MEYKCKKCGASLTPEKGQTVVTCSYCQSVETIAACDDEQKCELYNRANAMLLSCDFDKAMICYQSILNQYPKEAEAHWGMVLCKYGINYVVDPSSGKRKPTIRKLSYDSILQDADYVATLENADVIAKAEYQKEAEEISAIQQNILTISQKEQPFDIFISYKETDELGNRTIDSVNAQNIYDALTAKGYKVFFSRITLESKLGIQYEPYIFAALNSAKVMLVVGTKPEYFNAIWVKNEWSRFLQIMNQKMDRYLITCYRDMNPKDLPAELIALQGQDLNKVGFMQDLIRGIDKIFGKTKENNNVYNEKMSSEDKKMLERIRILIADRNWDHAQKLLNQFLVKYPRNSQGYLFAFLLDNQCTLDSVKCYCHDPSDIVNAKSDHFDDNLKHAFDFGDGEEKKQILELENEIRKQAFQEIYDTGMALKQAGRWEEAKGTFETIKDYKDSTNQIEDCMNGTNDEKVYQNAIESLRQGNLDQAKTLFDSIIDYKDSKEQLKIIEDMNEKAEAQKEEIYQKAKKLMSKGSYEDAYDCFEQIEGYRDSETKMNEIVDIIYKHTYDQAKNLFDEEKFKEAKDLFLQLGDYEDASEWAKECDTKPEKIKQMKYQTAMEYKKKHRYYDATVIFKNLGDYRDSRRMLLSITKEQHNFECFAWELFFIIAEAIAIIIPMIYVKYIDSLLVENVWHSWHPAFAWLYWLFYVLLIIIFAICTALVVLAISALWRIFLGGCAMSTVDEEFIQIFSTIGFGLLALYFEIRFKVSFTVSIVSLVFLLLTSILWPVVFLRSSYYDTIRWYQPIPSILISFLLGGGLLVLFSSISPQGLIFGA